MYGENKKIKSLKHLNIYFLNINVTNLIITITNSLQEVKRAMRFMKLYLVVAIRQKFDFFVDSILQMSNHT